MLDKNSLWWIVGGCLVATLILIGSYFSDQLPTRLIQPGPNAEDTCQKLYNACEAIILDNHDVCSNSVDSTYTQCVRNCHRSNRNAALNDCLTQCQEEKTAAVSVCAQQQANGIAFCKDQKNLCLKRLNIQPKPPIVWQGIVNPAPAPPGAMLPKAKP